MFLLYGGYHGVPVHSRLQHPKSRFTSSCFCSGGAVVALMRPVIPYTLALSSQRSWPVMSPAVRSTALFADQ